MSEMNRGGRLAVEPGDRDELVGFVGQLLREKFEQEPTVDGDGDFVLCHIGQPVWIRVQENQPVVEIFARVAHDVRSRRAAAFELGLLNRDHLWSRWVMRDRTVWQAVRLPGRPFVAKHLDDMVDLFFAAMSATRDDLALRLGAKVA